MRDQLLLLRLPPLLRLPLLLRDDERQLRRAGSSSLSPLSLSPLSSSPPVIFSLTPSRTPFVFDAAPPDVTDSMRSGSPSAPSELPMSRRLAAAAKRRYVSTLAIT